MDNIQITVTYNKQTGMQIAANREAKTDEVAAMLAVSLIRTMKFGGLTKAEAQDALAAAIEKDYPNE